VVVTATLSAQPTCQTAPKGSVVPSQKTIQEAQQRLQFLGFEPGTADGVMGLRTVLALKKVPADHVPGYVPGSKPLYVVSYKYDEGGRLNYASLETPEGRPVLARRASREPASHEIVGQE
jgi:peptidoglycan hydrolase-like protein with peptidoglycan-binding domain